MIFTRYIGFMFIFFLLSNFWSPLSIVKAEGESKNNPFRHESQKHLIRGVYYLINQSDLNAAESEFRQAIALDQHNWEAYYFLGRIYYELGTSTGDISISQSQQFIGKAKAFLLRAQELQRFKAPSSRPMASSAYDKLHPDLLRRLKQDYPKITPIYEAELFPKQVKIVIETEPPNFEIRASKISEQNADMIVGTFPPEEEIQLQGDTSYKLEFIPQSPKSIKHLLLIGIGLAIWLIR
jgi:tetratricopeptide (TPR) repeat protein